MPNARKKAKTEAEEIVIPDKLYFRIGEVAELSALPAYVLRFWETEFPQLKPTKGSTGQRMYRRRDVEHILLIKRLLYEEGYTIAGARDKLKAELRPARAQAALPFSTPAKSGNKDGLRRIRQELSDILRLLGNRSGKR